MENNQDVVRGEELGKFYEVQLSESDQKLRNDVLVALQKAPMVDAEDVNVEVKDGVVFLEGFVRSQDRKEAVEKLALNLMGVVSVENHINVSGKTMSASKDAYLLNRQIQNHDAITETINCFQKCTTCLNHCLHMGGEHSSAEHIKTLMECSEICNFAAKLMLMEGDLAYGVGQLCARACEVCADSCRSVDPNDETMAACIEACTKCAEACRGMEDKRSSREKMSATR